jgi:hypothetical protein
VGESLAAVLALEWLVARVNSDVLLKQERIVNVFIADKQLRNYSEDSSLTFVSNKAEKMGWYFPRFSNDLYCGRVSTINVCIWQSSITWVTASERTSQVRKPFVR